jgi:hypothetical protein
VTAVGHQEPPTLATAAAGLAPIADASAACFEPCSLERQVAEKKIELATIRLKADTNLVAYLRRRLKLYALFGLPPPPDVCE